MSTHGGSVGGRATTPKTYLRLLDGFELSADRRPLALPLPAQRLLAFLALQGHPLLRGFVAGSLWLETSDERAAGSLRSALWQLRRFGVRLVDADGHRLCLAPTVGVDVRDTVAWARRALDESAKLAETEIAEIWRRDVLLPDWYDDWVALERNDSAPSGCTRWNRCAGGSQLEVGSVRRRRRGSPRFATIRYGRALTALSSAFISPRAIRPRRSSTTRSSPTCSAANSGSAPRLGSKPMVHPLPEE